MFDGFLSKRQFNRLIQNGLPTFSDKHGNSILHLAIIHNERDLIEKLVQKPSHLYAKNCFQYTPTLLAKYLNVYHPKLFVDSFSSKQIQIQIKNKIHSLSKELFLEEFQVNQCNHLIFSSYKILQDCLKRTGAKLKKRQQQIMNGWSNALFKKAFEEGKPPKLLIKNVDSLVGWGVFADQDIAELSYVGEYCGIVRKRNHSKDRFNDYVFGFVACQSDTSYVIDAKQWGNFTRFINHSDEPNLVSKWIEVDGISHIIFFANRLIRKGEQLTYDYGPYYWRKRSAPITQF